VPAMSGYSTKKFDRNMTVSQAISQINNTIPSSLRSDRYRLYCNSLRMLDEDRTLGSYGVKDNVRIEWQIPVAPFGPWTTTHFHTLPITLYLPLIPTPIANHLMCHNFRTLLSLNAAGNSSYKTRPGPKRKFLSKVRRSWSRTPPRGPPNSSSRI
jgi:hypothetical protein